MHQERSKGFPTSGQISKQWKRRRPVYLLASLLVGLMERCQNRSQAVKGSRRMQRLKVIVGQGLVRRRHGSMVRWIKGFVLEKASAQRATS